MRKILSKINIIIFAFILTALMQNCVFADTATDVAWSWWTYPIISWSQQNGKAYFGFVTSSGVHGVSIYNPNTNKTYQHLFDGKKEKDDHNAPSVSVLPNGKILVIYTTGHNTDKKIHIQVSKNAGSVSSWGPETVIKSAGKTCYIQVFQYNGKVWMFYRRLMKNAGEETWAWCCRNSSISNLSKWSSEKVIFHSKYQCYCLLRETTQNGLLRIVAGLHANNSDNNLKMAFYDLKSDTLLQTDYTKMKNNPNISDYKTFFSGNGVKRRVFDMAVTSPEKPVIAYCTANSNHTADYYVWTNGIAEKILTSKNPFSETEAHATYFSGMSFVNENKLVAAYRDGKDKIKLINMQNGRKVSEKVLSTAPSGTKLIRPVVCKNIVMWQKGTYTQYRIYKLKPVFASL